MFVTIKISLTFLTIIRKEKCKKCVNDCFSSHYYYKEYFSYSQPVMGLAQSVSVQMKTVVCHVLFLVSYSCLGGA